MGSSNKGLWPARVRKPAPLPAPEPEPKKEPNPLNKVGQFLKENVVPEGPELAHSRDMLRELILNKQPSTITFHATGRYHDKPPTGFDAWNRRSPSRTPTEITDVGVKGKFMWWELSDDQEVWYLFTTYGMTGQWQTRATDHVTASIYFHDDSEIHFNDRRNFGSLKFVKGRDALEAKLKTLGPDMLNNAPSTTEFQERLRKRDGWNICKALMNQGVVSGVGNYVKCEALYRAGIDPNKTVKKIDDFTLHVLCVEIIKVMEESYRAKGASFNSYRNSDGSLGEASFSFRCYGRKEDEYGNPIEKMKTPDGRSTWWCPAVQRR